MIEKGVSSRKRLFALFWTMNYYRIAGVVLRSSFSLPAFKEFSCREEPADMELTQTDKLPVSGAVQCIGGIGGITCCVQPEGWFFQSAYSQLMGLYVSADYTRLQILGADGAVLVNEPEWFVRIAVECMLARKGFISLHAAAVEVQGEAYAFTGHSGMGKSTRARAWMETLGAEMISGDRPLIDVSAGKLYGVPWDGKERCFRNVCYPLKTIFEVRRSDSVYARALTISQRKRLLLRHCFLPMWDTDTAVIQMANISRLAESAQIIRAFCGPAGEDARALCEEVCRNHLLKEEPEMKARPGFILREVVGEKILMPTGDNIGQFNGTVLLNDLSAFVWQQLQNPVSRDDLLRAILDEYEVEENVAAADLDKLLRTFEEYGVIE